MTDIPAAPREAIGRPADRRRITTNFLAMFATSALGLVVGLVISIYVRRTLGPAAIGQVSWSMAVLGYLVILTNPGLTTIGQRELSRDPARGQKLLALLLTLQSILAVVVYAMVVAFAALEVRGETVSLLLVIQGLTLLLSAWNTAWVIQANERMVAPSIANLVLNVLQVPVLFLVVRGPADVYLYAACTLLLPFCGLLFNLWYIGRHKFASPGSLRPTLGGASRLLRDAWPLALAQGAVLIYYNCDTIILGFTDGDAAVGQYATAYKLMLVSSFITAALWNAYFPALARAHAQPAQATALAREYLGLLAWTGMPIAALGWACGRHLVNLMFGPAFAPSGPYFEWLCLNIAIMFVNYAIVSILVPWGYSKLQFKIAAAAATSNLLLNLVVIPLYGPWAAVATTLAAELVVLVSGIWVRRRLGIVSHPILPIIAPPLLCSTLVALAIVALPRSLDRLWWLEVMVGASVLGACFLLFNRRFRRLSA